jgi:putative copper resistance protein D
VHITQHVVLMMLAPLLLAYGAPVTLALRSLGPVGRRRLLSVLHEPGVRRLGRRPALLVIDYATTMAVVMLSPVQHLAERHLAIHIALHAYLIGCGGIFWAVTLARDPVPNRRPAGTRAGMVAACIPLTALLAAAVVLVPSVFAVPTAAAAETALILVVATLFTTTVAVAMIAPRSATRVASRGLELRSRQTLSV